jgi:hypothetical protein
MPSALFELLSFYGSLGRPLSFVEFASHISRDPSHAYALLKELARAASRNEVLEEDGFYWLSRFSLGSTARRVQDLLLDTKWRKLSRYARLLRHVPFVEFVAASGSLVFGNVSPSSDLDVLVGVRAGRMFTARYFLVALFSLFRARRKDDIHASSPDRLCFNHFVTPAAYEKEPHNYYRRELYRNMVPLWAERDAYRAFIAKNAAWSGLSVLSLTDARRTDAVKSAATRAAERLFSGRLGDMLERHVARPIAMARLAAYAKRKGGGERVVITDDELEFHFYLKYERVFSRPASPYPER